MKAIEKNRGLSECSFGVTKILRMTLGSKIICRGGTGILCETKPVWKCLYINLPPLKTGSNPALPSYSLWERCHNWGSITCRLDYKAGDCWNLGKYLRREGTFSPRNIQDRWIKNNLIRKGHAIFRASVTNFWLSLSSDSSQINHVP